MVPLNNGTDGMPKSESWSTRRQLLRNSAKASGGFLLLTAGQGSIVSAKHDGDEDVETRIYEDPVRTDVFTNPCTGVKMRYTSGYYRIVVHYDTDDPRSQGHATINLIDGVVTSVDNPDIWCRSNLVSNATWYGQFDPPWTETIQQTLAAGCHDPEDRGIADKFHYRLRLHVTVNANGEATVEIDDLSRECIERR